MKEMSVKNILERAGHDLEAIDKDDENQCQQYDRRFCNFHVHSNNEN